MRITLAAHMDGNGRRELYTSGFKSSDTMPGPVETALRQVGINYREPFACVAVYGANENPHDNRLPAWAWGPPVILKPEVLDRLEVACASDIQNAASGGSSSKIGHMFRNLRDVPDKEVALLELLRKRPPNTWTEARVFDFLRESDVAEDQYRGETAADLLFLR